MPVQPHGFGQGRGVILEHRIGIILEHKKWSFWNTEIQKRSHFGTQQCLKTWKRGHFGKQRKGVGGHPRTRREAHTEP